MKLVNEMLDKLPEEVEKERNIHKRDITDNYKKIAKNNYLNSYIIR